MLRNWSYYTATLNEMVVLVVITIAMNLICDEVYTDLIKKCQCSCNKISMDLIALWTEVINLDYKHSTKKLDIKNSKMASKFFLCF